MTGKIYLDIVCRMRKLFYLALLLWFPGAHAQSMNVAVASNLTHTITEISEAFFRNEGEKVNLTFGSSGNFARQIVQGAPYQVFISAGRQYVDFVRENGREINDFKPLVNGRLSLYIPETSKLEQQATLADALKTMQYGDFRRMAIANPEHAPYGQAAREALVNAGVWVVGHKKLLVGENAAQAMQFCLSGSVDMCIIPGSFLTLEQFSGRGTSFSIPQNWHPPITQYAVLLDDGDEQGIRYFNYLSSVSSGAVFKKYGYSLAE